MLPNASFKDMTTYATPRLATIEAATPNHNFCIASLKLDFARIVYMMPTIKEASKHSLKTIMNSFMYEYSNENDSH